MCHIAVFSPLGPFERFVALELSVPALAESMGTSLSILKVEWLPQSQTRLAITFNKFVKVYDLATDIYSPVFASATSDPSLQIRDSALIFDSDQTSLRSAGTTTLLVLTADGRIFFDKITDGDNAEPRFMCETLKVCSGYSCVFCVDSETCVRIPNALLFVCVFVRVSYLKTH